ncbi:hypothetical protein PC121_g13725 [Phytophthora cactorum]|nr:hypothetical protein PC120_g12995 [Phytophthora cactorum]KAG3059962.1 hypothetical protein PC121_g13725 [Phytophthora cactorum]
MYSTKICIIEFNEVFPFTGILLPRGGLKRLLECYVRPINEHEKRTAYAPPPAPTYRFVLTSIAEKVKITLEDLKNKKQWYEWESPALANNKYTTKQIDLTTEDDDVKHWESALDPGKIRRKLIPLKADAFQLELAVKIRIFQSAWTAKYLFKLEPVTLDRIDILEAKLHDVEEELEQTKTDLDEVIRERANVTEELSEVKDKLADMETALANEKNSKKTDLALRRRVTDTAYASSLRGDM